jgi:hypothetical protein
VWLCGGCCFGLVLVFEIRLASNSWSSYLSLPSAGITDVPHHAQLSVRFRLLRLLRPVAAYF